jgi:hypothetical protein
MLFALRERYVLSLETARLMMALMLSKSAAAMFTVISGPLSDVETVLAENLYGVIPVS